MHPALLLEKAAICDVSADIRLSQANDPAAAAVSLRGEAYTGMKKGMRDDIGGALLTFETLNTRSHLDVLSPPVKMEASDVM